MGDRPFEFLIVNDPSELAQPTHRRLVKSRAARHSWKTEDSRSTRTRRTGHARRAPAVTWVATEAATEQEDEAPGGPVVSTVVSVLGQGRVDPFRSYPSYKPSFPLLIDHYIVYMTMDVPGIDQPNQKGLLRHLCSVAATTRMATDILQLKSDAIRSINHLIQSPEESKSDSLIGAVVKLASFEAMYGDVHVYQTHMTGLQHIIDLRGGLGRLGLDGLLRRLVLWIDNNAAFLNKTNHFFANAIMLQDGELREPNPGSFTGG